MSSIAGSFARECGQGFDARTVVGSQGCGAIGEIIDEEKNKS